MNQQRQRERDLAAWLARVADPGSPQSVAAAAAFLLTFFVGLALAYRDAIPLFEAPDEPSHLHYASFVYVNERLPRQRPQIEVPDEGMQAPLVYVIAAPLLANAGIDVAWAADELGRAVANAAPDPKVKGSVPAIWQETNGVRVFASDGRLEGLRVARSTSLVFGLLTVILTFAAVWRLSHDARFALLAGAIVAFDPQFLFSSGYFSNDAAAAAIGAAALWIVVRAFEDPGGPVRAHYLAGGVLIALGALTKTSTIPSLAAAAVALIWIDPRERRRVAIDTALAAGCAALLAGPYAIWALEHRGGFLGVDAVVASAANMTRAERFGGLVPFLTGVYWDSTFESFWARFGWFNVVPPRVVYLSFFALCWTALLGWILGRSDRLPVASLGAPALHRYLFAAFGATLAAHFAMNLAIANPQGRLLFPALAQAGLLLALGLVRLVGSARLLPLTVTVVIALLALDVYCLRGVLLPAYR